MSDAFAKTVVFPTSTGLKAGQIKAVSIKH